MEEKEMMRFNDAFIATFKKLGFSEREAIVRLVAFYVRLSQMGVGNEGYFHFRTKDRKTYIIYQVSLTEVGLHISGNPKIVSASDPEYSKMVREVFKGCDDVFDHGGCIVIAAPKET